MSSILRMAQERAINRTMFHLKKGMKKTRDSLLNTGIALDIVKDLQPGMLYGMYTAYLFGRVNILGQIYAQTKELPKQFKDFSYIVEPLSVLELSFKYDGRILRTLAVKKILYEFIKEKDFYTTYFMPNEKIQNWMEAYTFQLALVQGENLTSEIQKIYSSGLDSGWSMEKISKELTKKIETLSKTRARAIAETETTRAYSIGFLEESYSDSNIDGYIYSTVNDKRRTQMCEAREGLFIPKSDIDLLAENTPPLHVFCRSMLKPSFIWEAKPKPLKNVVRDSPSKQRPEDVQVFKDLIFNIN